MSRVAVSVPNPCPSVPVSEMGIHKKAAAAVSDGGGARPRRVKRDPTPRCTCCLAEIEIREGGGAKRKRKKHILSACSSSAAAEIEIRGRGGAKWKCKKHFLSAFSSSSSAAAAPQANAQPWSWSWGAKRKRLPIPCRSLSGDGSGSRDWANLGDGPAGVIADLALAHDVADYVRFRAVCRPWRRCSRSVDHPSQPQLDARFLPRHWMMLNKSHDGRFRFLNVSTGHCIRMDLPELAEHTLLALTPEGLLLLFHEPSLSLRLLNPLTRRLTNLPPVTALLTPELRLFMSLGHKLGPNLRVKAAGLIHHNDDFSTVAVAVSFFHPRVLAIAKPSDESWTVVTNKGRRWIIDSALPFAGRFYCATSKGVMELNISSDPRLVMAAEPRSSCHFTAMMSRLHLIDNGGELMLVHRSLWHDNGGYSRRYEVYKVDLDVRILVPVKGLNGRALFIGMCRSISVSTEVFPSVVADTLYLGFDCAETTEIDGCNLADGGNTPRHRRPRGPCTAADCLSYCIQRSGRQLA